MQSRLVVVATAMAFAVLCTGCGTEEPPSDDGGVGECNTGDGLLYPLEEGAWWVDRITELPEMARSCKLLSVGAPSSIPVRPGQSAFPVRSERDDAWGLRWQELAEDGSVRRHVDEWFDLADDHPTTVVHYCPFLTRIQDGASACLGAAGSFVWKELVVEVGDAIQGTAAAYECAGIAVDPETCELLGALPEGCAAEQTDKSMTWEVLAIGEQVTVPAGVFAALHVRTSSVDETKDWWWARGVGKVKEEELDDREELVDYCLPAETDGCDAGPSAYLDAGCGE